MTTSSRGPRGKQAATRLALVSPHAGAEIRATSHEPYLTREQVAKRLQLSVGTIANWASAGKGPKCIRLANGRVRYPSDDYFAWEQAQSRQPR